MSNHSLKTTKSTKGERLGWASKSEQKPVDLKNIVGEGKKVGKNAFRKENVNSRILVP